LEQVALSALLTAVKKSGLSCAPQHQSAGVMEISPYNQTVSDSDGSPAREPHITTNYASWRLGD
jgi:hypothetical protein